MSGRILELYGRQGRAAAESLAEDDVRKNNDRMNKSMMKLDGVDQFEIDREFKLSSDLNKQLN